LNGPCQWLQGRELKEAASGTDFLPFHATWHEVGTPCKNGLSTDFAQRGKEPFAVAVVAKDRLAMIAAAHDVIDRAGIFYA
jgi:hypothetical protein